MTQIYLFPEHQKFQTGKSRLNKGAVFETNVVMIVFLLLGGIALMTLGGNSLRWQWRYEQTGTQTIGVVTDCREVHGGKGSYTTEVYYRYAVNGESFYDRDTVGGGRLCHQYPLHVSFTIYYLSDAPQESGIGAFLHDTDWTTSWMSGLIGLVVMVVVYYVMMKNRKERYKHAMLQQHADTILEATVEKVGEVKGKNGYKYADYVFTSPDMDIINGQIRTGKSYRWPKNIQRHDTLSILYLDNETYCVL